MADDIQYNNLDVIDASLVAYEEYHKSKIGEIPYVIEIQYGAQMKVRFEGPTAEEVIRLAKLYEEK